jgi:hypothetical protein
VNDLIEPIVREGVDELLDLVVGVLPVGIARPLSPFRAQAAEAITRGLLKFGTRLVQRLIDGGHIEVRAAAGVVPNVRIT